MLLGLRKHFPSFPLVSMNSWKSGILSTSRGIDVLSLGVYVPQLLLLHILLHLLLSPVVALQSSVHVLQFLYILSADLRGILGEFAIDWGDSANMSVVLGPQ